MWIKTQEPDIPAPPKAEQPIKEKIEQIEQKLKELKKLLGPVVEQMSG